MCFAKAPKDNSRELEAQRQARIKEGMGSIDKTFGQFTPDYYSGYETDFINLHSNDLAKQYKDAKQQAIYSLARGGNLRSTAGASAFGDLEDQRLRAEQELRDRARMEAQARRGQVEQSRNTLVSQLNATADPGAAARAAISQAELLTAPPAYSPIANVFANLTSQIADAQRERRGGTRNWASDLFGPVTPTGSSGSLREYS